MNNLTTYLQLPFAQHALIAATLIALADYQRDTSVSAGVATATVLDVVIGGVTFSGSLIAAAKLQGYWSQPVSFPGARFASAALTLAALAAGMTVYAVPNPHFPPDPAVLEKVAGVLGDISELPGALGL